MCSSAAPAVVVGAATDAETVDEKPADEGPADAVLEEVAANAAGASSGTGEEGRGGGGIAGAAKFALLPIFGRVMDKAFRAMSISILYCHNLCQWCLWLGDMNLLCDIHRTARPQERL